MPRYPLHATRGLSVLFLLLALSCQQTPGDAPTLLRLNPTALQGSPRVDAGRLFDRDTTTGLALDRPVSLTLSFAQDVHPQRLKVFARGAVRVELSGEPAFEALGQGEWESLTATTTMPPARQSVTLTLTPLAGQVRVEEVELWGPGVLPAPRDVQVLAERSREPGGFGGANVHAFSARPDGAVLSPKGLAEGQPCAAFQLFAPLPLGTVRRAHLVYEANGIQRPVVLRRGINGQPPQGGFWLGSGERQRTLADELNPEWLTGEGTVTLCLPDAATEKVTLSGVRLLLEQDDGSQPFEREVALRLGAALDGDAKTSASLPAGALELAFSRPMSVDSAVVELDVPAPEVLPATFDGQAWRELGATSLPRGRNALALDGRTSQGMRLAFGAGRRPDVPAASVSELLVTGSGIGSRVGTSRLVITYPRLRTRGEELLAEHFGDRAYLSGWAESPAGRGVVEVEGAPVDDGNGAFGVELTRPAGASAWRVTVKARFPDGSEVRRVITLDGDGLEELAADSPGSLGGTGSEQALFGDEEQTSWGKVHKEQGGKVGLGSRVSFEAPPGAVDGELSVGITRKVPEALPPLDPGMVNVTAPVNAGYRFSPPGQRFHKPVTIRLPYDASLLPEGTPPEQVQTFYYDRGEGQWKPLTRKEVVRASQQVVSETTHFTFMINAVLVLPDHPGPAAFDPNSIKDLKAADPSANMDLMEPPEGNAQGTARVGLTLDLPGARGGYAPAVQLAYDSSGGNGWVGVGWDVSVSSIQVDTRFGAPFYDGSERFLLDGEQLVPVGEGPCVGGSTGKRFAARVEKQFRRIVHCGEGTAADRFEVSEQDGVLLLYGVTPGARLASPDDAQDIGQWMLERVVDAHGNLALYRYTADHRKEPGTRFDQGNREDFRQLYPREILYSGKVARTEAALDADAFLRAAELGPYLVQFELEREGAALRERPDIQISGRMGFKAVTRYRLRQVKVRLNTSQEDTVIREYRFTYEQGDFGKSRLKRVEQFGVGGVTGGALFHSHTLEYHNVDDQGVSAFPKVVAWPFEQADDDAMTASSEWALGAHAYAGIGFAVNKQSGSVGARVGFNHRESTTHASLLDLNGDGLIDRVSKSGSRLKVQLNDGQDSRMSPRAPWGDPYVGRVVSPFVAGGVSLGSESGDSINAALQGTFANFSANVGLTRSWSTSSEFMQDVDGDGLVDYVGPNGILFNQLRGTSACAASTFCFTPSKPVSGTLDFGNLAGAQDVFSQDPSVTEAQEEVAEDFHPTDALLEWTAPFSGTVDISGPLQWMPERTPSGDGVRLRIYRDSELLAEYVRGATETAPTTLSRTGVEVRARQRLYFVLSTLRHFAVKTLVTPPVPLEEVRFAPVVKYTGCGGCGIGPGDELLEEPTGASVFTFDAEKDFKLAGEPLVAIQVPNTGTVRLTGSYSSAGAADDVRLCVQRFPVGQQVTQRACADTDLLFRNWPGGAGNESFSLLVGVTGGESLVFRMETDVPVDPDSVRWLMEGEMTEVCDQGGTCAPPRPEDRERLRFVADPYLPLHDSLSDKPLRPYIVPRDGILHVRSSGISDAANPFFTVRRRDTLLLKHRAGQSASTSFPVHQGDQIFFQAHAEVGPSLTSWDLDVELEVAGEDGGIVRLPVSVPHTSTYERPLLGEVKKSPFGGGFHGWRYGLWGGRHARDGRPDEPFDSALFYSDAELDLGGGGERDQFREGKKQLRDEESDTARRSRLYAPLVPRRRGTQVLEAVPGLKPEPAYVSQDGSAFIGKGTMHGGHKGAVANGPGHSRTVDGAFRVGKTSRASTSTSFAAGIGASLGIANASLNVSTGRTSQRTDVRDMNGDGIIDIVINGQSSGNGVRLTHLRQRNLRRLVEAPGTHLSESSDLTASMGMGLSSPVPQLSPKGRLKGMEGMFPSGFSVGVGVAATLSATEMDLVDVNGDGLADQVRREGGVFRVRLNLGSRFASQEDDIPVRSWQVDGDYDPLVAKLGIESPPDADEDERRGSGDALSVLGSLGKPDVVRRGTAVSLEGNIGLTIAEDYGVTANWSSSLNGTQVVLADVTGDGLPDYVRKDSGERAFRVMVNLGYGFSTEQEWYVPDWPTEVTRPRFKVNSLLDQTVIPLLGLKDGIDTVEASGSHSRAPSVGFVITVPIPLGPGTPWLHLSGGADLTVERVSGFELGLMDVNGDGLADHVLKTEEQVPILGNEPDASHPNRSTLYARLNGYAGANLLKKVRRPLGGSFTLTYERRGNTVDMPESRFVLTGVLEEDGLGGSATGHALLTKYEYEDGKYDRAERDFHGFARVTRTNPDESRVIQTYANDRYTHKGLLLREETRDKENRLFLATLNTFDAPVPLAPPRTECMAYTPFFLSQADYCASVFVPLRRVEHRFYESQTTEVGLPQLASAQTMQYDVATGNVTLFEDLGDLADPTDDLHSGVTYATAPALTVLHHQKLVEKLVVHAGTSGSPGALLRMREGFYDERGNLIRQLAHIAAGRVAEHLLTWNADGLLESMTSPPNARGQRYQVTYVYEPVTRSMVRTVTDSFGYASHVEYDVRFQEVRRTTDIAGNVTERTYDGFGRLSSVWGPYEVGGSVPTIKVAYDTAARPAWALTRNRLEEQGGDGWLDTVVFVDGLKRIIQTKKDAQVEGGTVGMSVTGHLTFDAMGRVAQKGQTTFDTGQKTAYVPGQPVRPTTDTYDLLGRVVRTVGADGSLTTMVYDVGSPVGSSLKQLRSTVTDALNNVRVLYRDVSDVVSAVEERIEGRRPTTRYETDVLGQLVRLVDAAGNTSVYTYDLLGRRTSLRTPDTGLTELRYDDANNLVERVDPNLRAAGLSIRYEHDYHRLVRVDHPLSDDVSYEYGPPGPSPEHTASRVTRVIDEVGTETRGYGRLGEVTRTTRTVRAFRPGDRPRTFETRFTFDSFGRMLRVRYPDAEEVRYTYDAGGLLAGATGYRPGSRHAPAEVQVYLRSLEYDHFGQRTSMVLGNGVKTSYTYEPETRRLSTLSTRTPRGRTLQALTYQYDRVGNVREMVNALGQPVGRRSGAVSYQFGYDELYRLTSARGVALARPGLVDRFESRFAYSDIHNMMRHTQVHELVSSRSGEANAARPANSNHDDEYTYGGTGPHQATRIGDTLLTYDANGNTLIECRTVNGSVCAGTGAGAPGAPETHNHHRRYVWTEGNTLRAVVDGGGNNATRFYYDADGERVVKLGRGGTSLSLGQFFSMKGKRHGTKHIFAGPTRLASKLLPVPDGDIGMEVAGEGTGGTVLASATVTAAPGDNTNGCDPSNYQPQKCPVVVPDPTPGTGSEPEVRPATYYYHPDHLGSTSWVTDQVGRVHEHVEYFPFGEVWRDQRHDDDGAPVRAPQYLFSAKEFDEETKLVYFGARYYDPRRARWVSADPFREEWGDQPPAILMSLYAYGNHSPLGWRDPTGKVPEWLHAALDVVGAVPVIGEVADGANALIYLSEGRYVEAGISAMGMIPVVGEAGKAGKWIAKGVKAGAETAVQKYAAKEIRSGVAQQGQKKFVKECSGSACGIPGKSCFVAGTLVTTRDGPRPIEEVREGEEVLSRDPSTGQIDWRPVVRTYVTPGALVLEVTLVAEDGTRETLGVTREHPFWVEGQGWTEAKDLALGSRILSAGDTWLTTEGVTELGARTTVFNFEVADFHTYFVGTQNAWVHNADYGPKFDSKRSGHIFRDAPGHVNPKDPQKMQEFIQLFQNVAGNKANLRTDAVQAGLITKDAAKAGVEVFTQTLKDGKQAWVTIRNGIIQNAGINPTGALR
ncbi:SpvB/TcaC N-terminal domain-containing protein [Archangium sp.]|uniref:SpvB/TcaC N-terminal domain-containing protein n=1 Tax=Archangium sp. TaxID=1872627 RepID=UPI00286A6FE6|nr:SpvB/TcaC N-terminal domain-containing protein [Archangium sp.]